jgi:DNA processing protein
VLGLLKYSHGAWGEVEGIGSHRASQILRDLPRAAKEAKQVMDKCDAAGVRIVCVDDEDYPALMRDLHDAPTLLYVRGRLEPRDINALAIVGSRNCSVYGREQAGRFASLLGGAGMTVVSGGARGIDSAAHEGALRISSGRTIAVLGSGVDVAYPPENATLFDRIAASGGEPGAVISHYPPGTAPNQRHFPERNRVISALSRGVLVIEADERSGSLITARVAADDHNRPVLAIPGRLDNPLSSGPHKLIRDGAALVTNLDEILETLGPPPESAYRATTHTSASTPSSAPRTSGPQAQLSFDPPGPATPTSPGPASDTSAEQRAILKSLSEHREASAEVIIEDTGLPAAVVLRELTMLTLRGKVRRVDAQTFAVR